METESLLFSSQDLKAMIMPLFLDQLLMALVGIADVFGVGFVGEAAVSGVSLVSVWMNLRTPLKFSMQLFGFLRKRAGIFSWWATRIRAFMAFERPIRRR